MYTVKQVSRLAGVSIRTLHYYDEIGLLKPSRTGSNGYRYYDHDALLRLQQILFYREMELELKQIQAILNEEHFDLLETLQSHRTSMQAKIKRMHTLIHTIDETIAHLKGEKEMKDRTLFSGFTPEEEKKFEEDAYRMWGDSVKESSLLWNSYSQQKKDDILQEGREIYANIVANMSHGTGSKKIQLLIQQWHQHLKNFYQPSLDTLRGLGELYCDHAEFRQNLAALNLDLPDFMRQAISIYVDGLEGVSTSTE